MRSSARTFCDLKKQNKKRQGKTGKYEILRRGGFEIWIPKKVLIYRQLILRFSEDTCLELLINPAHETGFGLGSEWRGCTKDPTE